MPKVNYIKRVIVDNKELVIRLTPAFFTDKEAHTIYNFNASYEDKSGGIFNLNFFNVMLKNAENSVGFAKVRFHYWLRQKGLLA